MRVVVAGGSGLIGRALARALADRGDEPVVLSRDPTSARRRLPGTTIIGWDPSARHDTRLAAAMAGADAVVDLAGDNLGRWPWTARRKVELLDGRLAARRAIVDALRLLGPSERPSVMVAASGTDVYEGSDATPATEATIPGSGFLSQLCVAWESAAQPAELLGVRVVRLRYSMIIDREAPALRRFAWPVRLFVGGPIGSGDQWVSWIHVADAIGLTLWAIDRRDIDGPLNAAAPEPCRQRVFAETLGRVLRRPAVVRTPGWLVRAVLGDQATMVLGSRRVWPERALTAGYRFRYDALEDALSAELAAPT